VSITTTLTLRPPGGAAVTINTDDRDDAIAGDTSAIRAATVTWGRSSVRDHQNAGRVTVVLRAAELLAVPFDSELSLSLSLNGRPAVLVAHGWVESMTYTGPDTRGRWEHSITCATIVGRAAATTITGQTWPNQFIGDRLTAIQAAAPIQLLDPAALLPAQGPQAPLTIDSDNALDLIQRAYASLPTLVVEGATGLIHGGGLGRGITYPFVYGSGDVTPGYLSAVTTPIPLPIAAAAVGAAPRQVDRSTMLTGVTVTTKDATGAQITTRYANAGVSTSSADTAITTDAILTLASSALRRQILHLLAENTTPTPVLSGQVPILLDQLDPATVEALIAIPGRMSAVLAIDGGPVDLEPLQAIRDATLTIADGRLTLDAGLEPARLAGVRPVRWSDFPDTDTLTDPTSPGHYAVAQFAHLDTVNHYVYSRAMTAARLRAILRPNPRNSQ
jgi:hypothetical protein